MFLYPLWNDEMPRVWTIALCGACRRHCVQQPEEGGGAAGRNSGGERHWGPGASGHSGGVDGLSPGRLDVAPFQRRTQNRILESAGH